MQEETKFLLVRLGCWSYLLAPVCSSIVLTFSSSSCWAKVPILATLGPPSTPPSKLWRETDFPIWMLGLKKFLCLLWGVLKRSSQLIQGNNILICKRKPGHFVVDRSPLWLKRREWPKVHTSGGPMFVEMCSDILLASLLFMTIPHYGILWDMQKKKARPNCLSPLLLGIFFHHVPWMIVKQLMMRMSRTLEWAERLECAWKHKFCQTTRISSQQSHCTSSKLSSKNAQLGVHSETMRVQTTLRSCDNLLCLQLWQGWHLGPTCLPGHTFLVAGPANLFKFCLVWLKSKNWHDMGAIVFLPHIFAGYCGFTQPN